MNSKNKDDQGNNYNKVTAEIFENGLLLSYSIGFWDGRLRQTFDDVEKIQGGKTDSQVFQPGMKLLLPASSVKPFYGYRSKLYNFLNSYSFPVPGLRGSRFIPKNIYKGIRKWLEGERSEFMADADEFIRNYPLYRDTQISKFNEKFPENRGALDNLYPPAELIRAKFTYQWVPYAWDYRAIEKIESQARQTLESKSMEIVAGASVIMRQTLFEELRKSLDTLQKSKKSMNSKSVARLKDKITLLKRINVFGDESLDRVVDNAARLVGSVTSWDVDNLGEIEFERCLKDVIGDAMRITETSSEELMGDICTFRESLIIEGDSDDDDSGDDDAFIVPKKTSIAI